MFNSETKINTDKPLTVLLNDGYLITITFGSQRAAKIRRLKRFDNIRRILINVLPVDCDIASVKITKINRVIHDHELSMAINDLYQGGNVLCAYYYDYPVVVHIRADTAECSGEVSKMISGIPPYTKAEIAERTRIQKQKTVPTADLPDHGIK